MFVAGAIVAWLDGMPAFAQDEEEVEINDGLSSSIKNNPHLYWKCWTTDSNAGSGFTQNDILGGGPFATPYLPQMDSFTDNRGYSVASIKGHRWKRTRADLIDARFYRGTGLVYMETVGSDPRYYATEPRARAPWDSAVQEFANITEASEYLGLEDEDGGAATRVAFNPYLTNAASQIAALNIEWETGSSRAGENRIDQGELLRQHQAADAAVTAQSVSRAGPYRGSGEGSGGLLDYHSGVYEDSLLGGVSVTGYRTSQGEVQDHVTVTSGTVSTSGSGGNVTTVVNLESRPEVVTNQVTTIEYNDPLHPELQYSGVAQKVDRPTLEVLYTSGWKTYSDTSEGSNNLQGFLAEARRVNLVPGRQLANVDFDNSCFYVGSLSLIDNVGSYQPEDRRREHRVVCWMVHASSEPESHGVRQTVQVQGGDLWATEFNVWKPMLDFNVEPDRPLAGSSTLAFDLPVWAAKPLEEGGPVLLNETPARRRGLLAPAELNDAPDDAILVSIELKEEFRQDPESSQSLTERKKTRWRMFGDEQVGRRFVRVAGQQEGLTYVGYNQSYMLSPFWGLGDGGGDRVIPWMYDHTEPLMNVFGMESMVLWPVDLVDMNYYLFRVGDFTKEHAGNRGHVLNLAYAGYGKDGRNPGLVALASTGPAGAISSYVLRVVQTYQGEMGVSTPVPPEVSGTSGRQNVLFTDLQLNPFVDGKLYYPFFDVNVQQYLIDNDYQNYPHSNVSMHDNILLHPTDLVKAGVVRPDDASRGEGTFGANARFQWRIQEGEPVPGLNAGGDRGSLYRRLGFDQSYLDFLKRIDQPYDPFAPDVRFTANPDDDLANISPWANSYMDPNETHVMVLTFYEGRLANEWRFLPKGVQYLGPLAQPTANIVDRVEDGYDAVRGETAEFIAAGANWILPGDWINAEPYKESLKRDVFEDLGAIPTFQYRRVICRVVVPPDGVVTPATGWSGVIDQLKVNLLGFIEGIKEAFERFIERIEAMPEEVMVGTATIAVEGVCHGGGLLDGVGAGTEGVESGSGGLADVVITGPEHEETEGREKCERVREEGALAAPAGECDEVAAAVRDRSCSPVPRVDFGDYVDGMKFEPHFETVDVDDYRDVWYYGYTGIAEPTGWQPYLQGFGLRESIDSVLPDPPGRRRGGYGWAWFDFPETHSSLPGIVNAEHPDSFRDLDNLLSMATGVDYDGYVLHVRADPRLFRYAECPYPDIPASWNGGGDWTVGEIRCPTDVEVDWDTGETSGFPWRVPAYVPSAGAEAEPVRVVPMEHEEVMRFVLPRYYIRYQDTGEVYINSVRGFGFGSVPGQTAGRECFDSLVPVFADYVSDAYRGHTLDNPYHDVVTGSDYACLTGPREGVDLVGNSVAFIGPSDWDKLAAYLDYVWYLADDAEFSFALSAYRGHPAASVGWEEGERSDWVTIKGGAGIACLKREVYWESALGVGFLDDTDRPIYESLDAYTEAWELATRYNCRALFKPGGELEQFGPDTEYGLSMRRSLEDARAQALDDWCGTLPDPFGCPPRLLPDAGERGVLGAQASPLITGDASTGFIFGSSVCGGFWSGTPDGFSWDSNVVWTLWSISLVLGMVLLFVLLLWDSLSMIYSGWLTDGRGGVSVASMLPRFLVALVLMLLSLYIARITLGLAGDATCFFVHATGMTFWGFVWGFLTTTMMMVIHIFGAVFAAAGVAALVFGGATAGTGAAVVGVVALKMFIAIGGIMLGMLLFGMYYAIKCFGGMLVRIVLLVILIGLGPIAFAMYASESTSHWTKRWVSLFLGTVFQQIAVLVVLFAGGSLARSFWGEAAWWNIWEVFLALLMMLMVLFLAARVPDIVNPGAKGMFSGFGQALVMAAAAGTFLAGGIGGAVGGLAGGGQGITGGAQSAFESVRNRIGGRWSPSGSSGGGGGGGSRSATEPPESFGEESATAGERSGLGPQGGDPPGVGRRSGDPPGLGPQGVDPPGVSRQTGGGQSGYYEPDGMPSSVSEGFTSSPLSRMARGFAAGAAQSSLISRGMMDFSSGRAWTMDPTVQYTGQSRAQLQSFDNYIRGVENDPSFERAAQRARLNRGYGGGASMRRGGADHVDYDPSILAEIDNEDEEAAENE